MIHVTCQWITSIPSQVVSNVSVTSQYYVSHHSSWIVSYVNEWLHMSMSYVTRHYQWVTSLIMSHVTCQWVILHIAMSHVICQWVTSLVMSQVTCQWVMSHVKESCHWHMSMSHTAHVNQSYHTSMSHFTSRLVMPLVNESCHMSIDESCHMSMSVCWFVVLKWYWGTVTDPGFPHFLESEHPRLNHADLTSCPVPPSNNLGSR